MAVILRVDPAVLYLAGDGLASDAQEHAAATAYHLDDFADATTRWRGTAMQQALRQAVEMQQERHDHHQRTVTGLAQHAIASGWCYSATDDSA